MIIKRSTGERPGASVRHEFELLRDVMLPGVVRVLGLVDTGSELGLVMEDAGDGIEMIFAQRQMARALAGATSRPGSFDDEEFVEARFLEEAGGHETALGHYWVAKLQTAYLLGDCAGALECSREAERRILKGILGMITSAEHVYYTALATAAAATSPASDGSSSLEGKRKIGNGRWQRVSMIIWSNPSRSTHWRRSFGRDGVGRYRVQTVMPQSSGCPSHSHLVSA